MVCRQGDIRETPAVAGASSRSIDGILQPWPVSVPSIARPLTYSEENIQGTLNLLECCRQYHVRQLLFGSSSSVYGYGSTCPLLRTMTSVLPVSPYAATKRAGELLWLYLCASLSSPCGMSALFYRVCPYQRPDLAIHKFCAAHGSRKPLPVLEMAPSQRD